MMMGKVLLPMLALSITGLAQDVRYNFAKDADFSAFKTYKWVDMQKQGGVQLDQIMDNQLKAAFDAELATKGLKKVEGDDANLAIGYQAALSQEKQITSFDSGWGYGPGWRGGWYGGGGGMTTSTTSTINMGAVALDMYDVPKKQLVWRGVATKTIDEKAKPEKRSKNIQKAVKKLLKNYPPKKES